MTEFPDSVKHILDPSNAGINNFRIRELSEETANEAGTEIRDANVVHLELYPEEEGDEEELNVVAVAAPMRPMEDVSPDAYALIGKYNGDPQQIQEIEDLEEFSRLLDGASVYTADELAGGEPGDYLNR